MSAIIVASLMRFHLGRKDTLPSDGLARTPRILNAKDEPLWVLDPEYSSPSTRYCRSRFVGRREGVTQAIMEIVGEERRPLSQRSSYVIVDR